MQNATQTTTTAQTSDAYSNFINSLDSEESRLTYRKSFVHFMRFCKKETYDQMLEEIQPTKKLEGLIRDFIIHLRDEKKVSSSTIMTYSAAVAHFYEMNDVIINWRKLRKFKGKMRKVVEDVPYTRDQIKTLLDRATPRDRCIILLMASAGLRRGGLPGLRLKDLQRIPKYSLYKIFVYKKEQEQYITYCTPECAKLIDQYLDWRARLGEELTAASPLFRKEFDTPAAAKPQPIVAGTISLMMARLLDRTGVRPRTQTSYIKSSLMECHGFRKFFDTQCINHNMNPLYAEYLMGHKTGLMKSYFKPSDMELLEGNDKSLGYAAIIPYLTINATEEENQRLKQQLVRKEIEYTKGWEMARSQIIEIKKKLGLE